MSFDPCFLKALLPEFNQLAAEFPDEFVAFAKFENATGADLDRFTPVYLDLADRTLRPYTFLGRESTVTDPDGKTRGWKAPPPLRLQQFAAGQEEEFLLWEIGHGPWSRFRELMGRAWNCLPQGAYVPKPLCHFAGTPQLFMRDAAEFWPNFVANLLRNSGKLVVVDKFPDHRAEAAYLTVGLFAASRLAIEKLLDTTGDNRELLTLSGKPGNEETMACDACCKCARLTASLINFAHEDITLTRVMYEQDGRPVDRALEPADFAALAIQIWKTLRRASGPMQQLADKLAQCNLGAVVPFNSVLEPSYHATAGELAFRVVNNARMVAGYPPVFPPAHYPEGYPPFFEHCRQHPDIFDVILSQGF